MRSSHRRIDHLVIAVNDLDAAADFYRRLGFQVGSRNRHPWGTENRLIQFGSSFLELITVGDPDAIPPHEAGRFSFGAFVRDYLDRREGCAMFVLDSADAETDAAAFSRQGIGRFEPFYFERKGQRPDGSETHVAFTLAFAMDPKLPDASFFVCQQHCPEQFWNADLQMHPNGATDIRTVTLGTANPADHEGFLSAFTGVGARKGRSGEMTYALRSGGQLRVIAQEDTQGFLGFGVAVPDVVPVSEHLARMGIRCQQAATRMTVRAEDAFGVTISLVKQDNIGIRAGEAD